MIHLLLGKPGAGKTTIGKKLEGRLNYKFISMGELLRTAALCDNSIKDKIENGGLVDNDVCKNILKQYLSDTLFDNTPIILDGFPRNLDQMKILNINIVKSVIIVDTDDHSARLRLEKRARNDDNAQAINNRFSIYKANIDPILDYVKNNSWIKVDIVDNRIEEEAYFDTVKIVKDNNG